MHSTVSDWHLCNDEMSIKITVFPVQVRQPRLPARVLLTLTLPGSPLVGAGSAGPSPILRPGSRAPGSRGILRRDGIPQAPVPLRLGSRVRILVVVVHAPALGAAPAQSRRRRRPSLPRESLRYPALPAQESIRRELNCILYTQGAFL